MAFIRYKKVNDYEYFQVARNYREGGKHRQEVLCHLGVHSSLEDAIAHRRQVVQRHLDAAAAWQEEALTAKGYLLDFYGVQIDTDIDNDEVFNEAIRRANDVENLVTELRTLRPLYRRYLHEYGAVEGAYEYYTAKRTADLLKERANAHQAKLDTLLEVQQKYF